QQIWITFDAISDDNKDVYALSVPACFVVDTVLTSVKQIIQNNTLPNDFALFQNYPNPFNSSTTIKYSLAEKCDVSLEIYDINGRLVDEINFNNQEQGEHEFRWMPQSLSSGVYLVKIQTGNWQKTIKAILLK
ncbi:MAG TPA: T9SS type A sorting domain-containing protein, partial [bacterium]